MASRCCGSTALSRAHLGRAGIDALTTRIAALISQLLEPPDPPS
jgi:hypothetical protein